MDVWSNWDELSAKENGHLTARERQFVAFGWLRTELNGGGFDQYFLNSAGDSCSDALKATESVGPDSLAQLIREAIARLNCTDPSLRTARQEVLEGADPETFADLDDAYYTLESTVELDALMLQLISPDR